MLKITVRVHKSFLRAQNLPAEESSKMASDSSIGRLVEEIAWKKDFLKKTQWKIARFPVCFGTHILVSYLSTNK